VLAGGALALPFHYLTIKRPSLVSSGLLRAPAPERNLALPVPRLHLVCAQSWATTHPIYGSPLVTGYHRCDNHLRSEIVAGKNSGSKRTQLSPDFPGRLIGKPLWFSLSFLQGALLHVAIPGAGVSWLSSSVPDAVSPVVDLPGHTARLTSSPHYDVSAGWNGGFGQSGRDTSFLFVLLGRARQYLFRLSLVA